MLICTVRRAGHIDAQFEWEPGSANVSSMIFGLNGTLVQVSAFGPALEWIKEHIQGIRMSVNVKNKVNWVGEDAAFIMNNLPRPV